MAEKSPSTCKNKILQIRSTLQWMKDIAGNIVFQGHLDQINIALAAMNKYIAEKKVQQAIYRPAQLDNEELHAAGHYMEDKEQCTLLLWCI